jgi:GNAT superfamily N-acetyltransferase
VIEVLTIEPLVRADIAEITASFAAIGWSKPAALYEGYLADAERGTRIVRVARWERVFAGYVTLNRESSYPAFRRTSAPEVEDLNVLPSFRRQGIATRLLDEAEQFAALHSRIVGIGVGLGHEYGAAQRLYVLRGYVPDGQGVESHGVLPNWGDLVTMDDNLVLHLTKRLGS